MKKEKKTLTLDDIARLRSALRWAIAEDERRRDRYKELLENFKYVHSLTIEYY